MKRKLLLIINLFVIFSLIIIVYYMNIKNLVIKTKDIDRVIIQYRTNKVLIEEPEELQKLFNNLSRDFKLHNIDIGGKGWVYWIKCYNSNDSLIYDFSILSDNLIKIGSRLYKTNDVLDLHYFKNLFSE